MVPVPSPRLHAYDYRVTFRANHAITEDEMIATVERMAFLAEQLEDDHGAAFSGDLSAPSIAVRFTIEAENRSLASQGASEFCAYIASILADGANADAAYGLETLAPVPC